MHTNLSQLTTANWLLVAGGLAFAFTGTIAACRILAKRQENGSSLLPYVLLVHLGLTIIMVAVKSWPVAGMILANIGLVPCYYFLVRMMLKLEATSILEPIPWKMIGRNMAGFLAGLGILAASMAI